ncbi:MAG: DUF1343 domain-containing protein [Deltaproteobacteria bacterium]|jgi:uncharacterized protein YbbC (DUF1343 family)|nr:DUF1343 domain-containing protein [Deltaproteobacteria bacterium]
MRLGIDLLLDTHIGILADARIGILANAASVTTAGKSSIERLLSTPQVKVTAIFGPEHGIDLSAQDMEPVNSCVHQNIPIHSLYGKTLDSLTPTEKMLSDIDVLVIDLQDIGSRYYTYVWTACLCMKICAQLGKKVIICDRPNPIGGIAAEGGKIEKGYASFVGLHSIPNRHGMTIGEIVHYVNGYEKYESDLIVIPIEGWSREMNWFDTGLNWQNPSPNMRSYEAALIYPGMCLIEGTNISEGRGTAEPFMRVGAPFINAKEFCDQFNAMGIDGITAAPDSFTPTHQKWSGKKCSGVKWGITDSKKFKPYLSGLTFIWLANKLYKDKGFEWRKDPYEFVTDKPAIDLLTGSDVFRSNIDSLKFEDLIELSITPQKLSLKRNSHLIY